MCAPWRRISDSFHKETWHWSATEVYPYLEVKERGSILRGRFIGKRISICSTIPWARWTLASPSISTGSASPSISTARRGYSSPISCNFLNEQITSSYWIEWVSHRIFFNQNFDIFSKLLHFKFQFPYAVLKSDSFKSFGKWRI